jgi:hypothetical protein
MKKKDATEGGGFLSRLGASVGGLPAAPGSGMPLAPLAPPPGQSAGVALKLPSLPPPPPPPAAMGPQQQQQQQQQFFQLSQPPPQQGGTSGGGGMEGWATFD